jgi:hypothetical protein
VIRLPRSFLQLYAINRETGRYAALPASTFFFLLIGTATAANTKKHFTTREEN